MLQIHKLVRIQTLISEPSVKARTLLPMIWKNVSNDSTIFTDELHQVAKLGYAHEVVQHTTMQYVSGTAHANTIESLLNQIASLAEQPS